VSAPITKCQVGFALFDPTYLLSIIEPIGVSPAAFERAERISFLGEIKRTGKVVYSAE